MNRSNVALFIAVLIHAILLSIFWLIMSIEPNEKSIEKEEKKIKISLKELPKKYKKSGLTKEKVPEPKIAPPMPKGSQLEKIEKKPPVEFKPKKEPRETKLNKPKATKKNNEIKKLVKKVKPLPPVETYIPLEEDAKTLEKKAQVKEEKPLYSILSEDRSEEEKNREKKQVRSGSSIANNIKELYGEEFGKLSPGQQKYILDNQEIMRRITQQVLNRVARVNIPHDLNVNSVNVIEFYLHPNGDMTDFKFLQKSNYYILDETTRETIEYAYSRYPRPKEKTLIRYNVFYNLARY